MVAATVAVPSFAFAAETENTNTNTNVMGNNVLSDDYINSQKQNADNDYIGEIYDYADGVFNINSDIVSVTQNSNKITLQSTEGVLTKGTAVPQGDIRWDFVTDEESFNADDKNTTVEAVNGNLRVTGANQHIKASGISIKPGSHKYLYIKAKNNSSCWKMQIYLFKGGYTHIYRLDYLTFNNQKKHEYLYYKIPLSDPIIQAGTLQEEYDELRLDFLNVGTGNIDIDYMVISGEEYLKEDDFVNSKDFIKSISVGGKTIDCGNAQKPIYYEAEIYEDIYKTLNKDSVSAEIKAGEKAEVTDITIKDIKDIKDRKIIDITVKDGNNAQSVRVVCKSVIRPVYLDIKTCDINRKSISFSGNLTDDNKNPLSSPVTVIDYKNGETVDETSIKFLKIINPDSDGNFSMKFNVNDKEETAEKYEMTILFDALGTTAPEMRTVTYLNDKYALSNIELLKVSDKDIFEFMSAADNKIVYERLGVWLDLYNSQTEDTKKKINGCANKYKGSLTENNTAEIANASVIAVIAKDLFDESLAELIKNYDEKSCKTEISGKRFSDFDLQSQKDIASKLKKNYSLDDYKKLQTALGETMLIHETSLVSYMKLKDLLLNNTDILGDKLTELSSVTDESILDTAMKAVSKTAKNSGFTSAKALVQNVKAELKKTKEEAEDNKQNSSNKNHGSSSGGSSGSFGLSGKPANTDKEENKDNAADTDKENSVTNNSFNDMQGYEWALEAVNYLAEKGIVNGVGDNNFDPDATVKREEFVKMIVSAFGINESEKVLEFDDIKKDDWCYPYVAAATEKGIINGISDSIFGVGEDIKREDMAVIIYRSLNNIGKSVKGNKDVSFTDYDKISDYAKTAVLDLASNGVINGMDDNKFSPAKSANRAEAAVIIHRCIEKLK